MQRHVLNEPKMRLHELLDHYGGIGQIGFSISELRERLGGSRESVVKAARRLVQKRKLMSPRKGYFVLVPPQYRKHGAPLELWYLEQLMREYHDMDYYVGLLSAAALHGASHQSVHVCQVVVPKQLPCISQEGVNIQFVKKSFFSSSAVCRIKTETGYVNVSTPEATTLDLARYNKISGHLDHVATVLTELGECIDSESLAEAGRSFATVDLQRAGLILDEVGHEEKSQMLHKVVEGRKPRWVPLKAGETMKTEPRNAKWKVVVNHRLAPDL